MGQKCRELRVFLGYNWKLWESYWCKRFDQFHVSNGPPFQTMPKFKMWSHSRFVQLLFYNLQFIVAFPFLLSYLTICSCNQRLMETGWSACKVKKETFCGWHQYLINRATSPMSEKKLRAQSEKLTKPSLYNEFKRKETTISNHSQWHWLIWNTAVLANREEGGIFVFW